MRTLRVMGADPESKTASPVSQLGRSPQNSGTPDGAPRSQGQRSFPLPWRGLLLSPKARVEYDRPHGLTIGKESTPLWNMVKTILEMHFFRWITFRGVLSGYNGGMLR